MDGRPPSLGKVADIRVQVEAETGRMLDLARRVGKRLRHALYQTADTRALPDEDWRETAQWYSKVMAELKRYVDGLPEKPEDKPMDDAAYAKELELISREHMAKMTDAERREYIQSVEQELAEKRATVSKLHQPSVLDPAPGRWDIK